MEKFDLLFDIAIRTVRVVDGHTGEARTNVVPIKKDGHLNQTMKPFVASKQELDCIKDSQPMPETHDLDGSNVSP
jgi:hypothetical protein